MPRGAPRVGRFELGAMLGSGGFGKVYLGHDTKAGKEVAIKLIDKDIVSENGLEAYVDREIEILRSLNHPHCVRLVQIIEQPKFYAIAMELAPNGELFDKILESRRFDERTARRYFQQMMSAVCYLHHKKVVHRDLKAENLLLGHDGELKICDFGLSRYAYQERTPDHPVVFTSLAGSLDYQAPEILKSEGYFGFSCDVWSCGVILFFMLCGYLPFACKEDKDTKRRILAGQYNKKCQYLSSGAADLISKILVVEIDKRFKTQDILNHPWFSVDLDHSLFPLDGPMSPKQTRGGSCRSHESGGLTPGTPLGGGVGSPTQADLKLDEDAMFNALRQAFRSCNTASTGSLSRSEVRDVLIKLNGGDSISNDDVDAVMACFKISADGTVSEEEFVNGWAGFESQMQGRVRLEKLINIFHFDLEGAMIHDLRRVFDELDLDNSGVITVDNVLGVKALEMSEDDAKNLIQAMDLQHKRKTVTFEDFVNACTKIDLLRRHPAAAKLQRLVDLFSIMDRQFSRVYLSNGFTVSGLRGTIADKLIQHGREELSTEFEWGATGNYLHGRYEEDGNKKLDVGIKLLPSVTGYTRVLPYRIGGRTELFHDWFQRLRMLLHPEIVRCAEDTAVKGDPELL